MVENACDTTRARRANRRRRSLRGTSRPRLRLLYWGCGKQGMMVDEAWHRRKSRLSNMPDRLGQIFTRIHVQSEPKMSYHRLGSTGWWFFCAPTRDKVVDLPRQRRLLAPLESGFSESLGMWTNGTTAPRRFRPSPFSWFGAAGQ